ncbi:PHB depolymerase family esterase [Acuticoccus sp. I52.16.1]|uniref:extracellular catalytic domain type 1 short-chain-length polyhydroxyalkanoate depolymerase n=1 Tax=Acuticoccus sp. I52.16.1 TaxID=2928472 RepID=UPI001FD117F8|nr:PHB depolymerase family esterase [Acuticoccus sp. I52.16.1]UOM36545.1 PHB depolymerase family esterase [Acuticoccus sp. I52.16.1]
MNDQFAAALRQATAAVRDGQPGEATAIIRSALGSGEADMREADPQASPAGGGRRSRRGRGPERPTHPLGKVVETLMSQRGRTLAPADPAVPPTPDDAEFTSRGYDGPDGHRGYRLFNPDPALGKANGLIVMLHGCHQTPDDFAAGTNMNRLAAMHGLLVAYPGQPRRANMAGCWNWFDPSHQRRGTGEPAMLAGLTTELRDEFGIPSDRVFVAGLSAGGAMAAVLVATYPELFAAAGIHSGLGYGAASDVMSAFSAMNGGGGPLRAAEAADVRPRLIIVHGTADTTVAPSNAATIFNAMEDLLPAVERNVERVAGPPHGRPEVVHRLEQGGSIVAEMRMVDGMGHAWSGGSEAGSYTDPAGPDASAAMVRFFLAQDGRP